ncbi:MAG TPA: hypothetical protein VHB73_03910, partial [Alphaproteobacteria bacterium]|nr:hypothetical protein [Alphaproteobacteria bacterium]
ELLYTPDKGWNICPVERADPKKDFMAALDGKRYEEARQILRRYQDEVVPLRVKAGAKDAEIREAKKKRNERVNKIFADINVLDVGEQLKQACINEEFSDAKVLVHDNKETVFNAWQVSEELKRISILELRNKAFGPLKENELAQCGSSLNLPPDTPEKHSAVGAEFNFAANPVTMRVTASLQPIVPFQKTGPDSAAAKVHALS